METYIENYNVAQKYLVFLNYFVLKNESLISLIDI